jgi:DNA-binding response OmpR family regulator
MNTPQVLLVDDDVAVAGALAKALGSEGFAVRCAGDAGSAVALFVAAEPDLVLLDLGLPDASGWDVFEYMTRTAPYVPIVVVTARPAQLELSRAAGVAALVEKPADIAALVATLRRLLGESQQTRLKRLALGTPAPQWLRPVAADAAAPGGVRRRPPPPRKA